MKKIGFVLTAMILTTGMAYAAQNFDIQQNSEVPLYQEKYYPSQTVKGNQTLKVNKKLKNSGKYDGAEIVQLYIRDMVGSNTRPVKELKGFQKIFLKAGESKTVTFNVTPEDLKFYDNNLKYDWESGEFEIFVGGDSQKTVSQKITWNK